jgi:hypothetical protein
MHNIPRLLVLVLFGGAGLLAIFATISLLFPLPVKRARLALEASLGRALLLGFVNFLFAGVVAGGFIWLAQRANAGPLGGLLGGIALLIAVSAAVLALLGLSGLSVLLGSRIGKARDELTPVLRGGLLILLAGFTPYLGWLLFAPLAVWTGLGAGIQAVFRRRPAAPDA